MFQVIVGDHPIEVSEAEHVIANMPKDTPIEWGGGLTIKGLFGNESGSGVGVLRFTTFYDGVVGHVDLGIGGKRIQIFPACTKSFWVKRLEDLSRLPGPGKDGDGI